MENGTGFSAGLMERLQLTATRPETRRPEPSIMIKLKRAYEAPSRDDGLRILVERLWPRGLSKTKAQIDRWFKELAPSNDLRKWYGHEIDKWPEFKKRYRRELQENKEVLAEFAHLTANTVTFVYAAKDELHNSAVVLKDFIQKKTIREAK